MPGDGTAAGIHVEGASLETGPKPVLTLALSADPPLAHPDAFVEGPDGVGFGAPVMVLEDPAHPLLKLRAYGNPPDLAQLANGNLVITVVDGDRTSEASTIPVVAAPPPELAALLPMMLTALIGGLILNLMPCVLPVLSLKLLGAVGHASGGSRALRRGFLATSAGILLSFLLLAGVMIGLRAGGVSVGWGLQFQQPVFLAAMAALTTLFAANLWGWFEVPLPRFIADRGPASQSGSLAGNIAAGAFATLLATPCSAPFLGTAIGFAFAGSSLDILVIFAMLGLGLALPYLAVALVPGVARWLPKPGRWMIVLRRILGLALLGTAAWLAYVLSAETGESVALVVAAALAAMLVSLGALEASRLRAAGASLAVVVALAAAAIGPALPGDSGSSATADALWQPFDRTRIDDLVAEGKVVFVDVTAQWCLTCQANKRLVLDRAAVRDGLRAPGTVAMAADWTRPDPIIAAYLKSYGRYGIPFNAVYGPSAPQGIALSEVLTPSDVLSALERARSPASAAGVAPQIPPSGG